MFTALHSPAGRTSMFPALSCLVLSRSSLELQGEWDEARTQLRALLKPSSRVRPSVVTFNTIMAAFMRHGLYDQVSNKMSPAV